MSVNEGVRVSDISVCEWWTALHAEIIRRRGCEDIDDVFSSTRDWQTMVWFICDRWKEFGDMPVPILVDRLTEEGLIPGL